MLTFKTQFPLDSSKGIDDLIEAGRIWLSKSPHSSLAEKMEEMPDINDEWYAESLNEKIIFHKIEDELNLCAFRHENIDPNGIRWVTEVAGSKTEGEFWVSIQLSVDSELPLERVDQGKRPYILKTLMLNVGGGMDGKLPVSDKPYYVEESGIDLVADIITGSAGCVMPTVYVSVNDNNEHHIDAVQLAQWLSGMAHVVVEPSRTFSFRLMVEVDGENAYGGAVAIYWPDGIGKWIFIPKGEYLDPRDMQNAISRKVRSSLLSQRTKNECRWGFIQELKAKKKLLALKEAGSDKVDDYIALFDEEISAKDEEIRRLESEILRLKYGFCADGMATDTLKRKLALNGVEQDLYQAERLSIVLDALITARDSCEAHSRRKDVLNDLIDNNSLKGERDTIIDNLKLLLRGYTSMVNSTKRELENMGFSISEEGKHYKLVFRGDQRYPCILAKTGSDHRGGLNAFSDIKKKLF